MNCEKFEFFGYETRGECLLEQEKFDISTIGWQTNQQSTDSTQSNLGQILGVIAVAIIASLGFVFGTFYLIRYLIVRKIVGLFASAMSRPFKASQAKVWKKPSLKRLIKKLQPDTSDLQKNLSKIRKIFVKTESEDLEAGNLKVSNILI